MSPGDPADSPRASTRITPADSADSLQDLLAEPLLLAQLAFRRISPPRAGDRGTVEYVPLDAPSARALVGAQIASAGLDPRDGSTASQREFVPLSPDDIREILAMMSFDGNRTVAVRALCWLRLLGKEERSLDEIGAEFGVVRATVDAIYRKIQDAFAARGIVLESRGDKDSKARAACRERRLGKRKKRSPWRFANLCKNPIPIPLP